MILASGQGPTGAWLTCAAAEGFCPPFYRCSPATSRRAPATWRPASPSCACTGQRQQQQQQQRHLAPVRSLLHTCETAA